MGRHSKPEQPEAEPGSGAQAPPGRSSTPPSEPRYDGFVGPTDDQVFVSRRGAHRRAAGYDTRATPYDGHPVRPKGDAPAPSGHAAPRDAPRADHVIPSIGRSARSAPPEAAADGAVPPAGPPEPSGSEGADASAPRRMARFVGSLPFPLMPIVALVIAVGIVSYALSTQQISLNFAGGAPRDPQGTANDSQVSQQGKDRAAEAAERADGLVVAFRVASRDDDGFTATATVTNRGKQPVAAWALAFKIPNSAVAKVQGAEVVKVGTLTKVHGSTGIPPGDAVKIVFTATGAPAKPGYCLLNERVCTMV